MPEPRSGFLSAFADGKLICMGGEIEGNFTLTQAEDIGLDPALNVYVRSDVYDVAADSWSRATDPPLGLHSGCSVVYNDRLYIFGGKTAAGGGKGKGTERAFSISLDDFFASVTPTTSVTADAPVETTPVDPTSVGEMPPPYVDPLEDIENGASDESQLGSGSSATTNGAGTTTIEPADEVLASSGLTASLWTLCAAAIAVLMA